MPYGALVVGRLQLAEPTRISENGRRLQLAGQESMPPSTRAQVYAAHADLLSLNDELVPVVFPDKPERTGFYQVVSASSDLLEWPNEVVTADWKLELQRAGSAGEVDLEAIMKPAARSVASTATGTHWHGLPVGATAYDTGATLPLTISRTGQDGVVPVYYSVPLSPSPRWHSTAVGYLLGRARILDNSREASGLRDVDTDGWEVSNSLVRVRPSTGGASLEISAWASGAWKAKDYALYADTDLLGPWISATILRNDLERVTLRLTSARPLNGGRLTLDVSLRRGSRFAELRATTGVASFWTAEPAATETGATTGNYRYATGDDADGLRFQIGSTAAFVASGTGGLTGSSAAQTFAGWIGTQAGGSPAPGESFADMQAQYIGAPAEQVRAVLR